MIPICRFNGIKDIIPATFHLNDVNQLVGFFTENEPRTVKKEERNVLFSMAIYKPGTTRKVKNVESLSGMVFDFDEPKILLPDFIKKLNQLDLIYLIYTTWSHTETQHRWRLIFPFEKPVSADFWYEAHPRVLNLLGNPDGMDESASKDVARMWYMPYKAAEQPYEISYELSGKFLDPSTLPPTAKPDLPIPSEYPPTTRGSMDEALNCIDPKCNYKMWLDIGMGLHDKFDYQGFQMWNSWSSRGGEKYPGIDELQTKWDSFTKGEGVTISTMIKYAMDAGWRPTPEQLPNIVITGTSSKPTEPTELTEPFNEEDIAEEFIDPVEECISVLQPFAVADIFDFPCPIFKNVFDWMQSVAPLPQPIFSLSGTLSLMAFLKRNAVISYSGLRPNLYILTIGPSRSGKNNALICVHKILEALELQEYEISSFGSAQGLMAQLAEKEGQTFWLQDEISHTFKSLQNKNAASYETQLEQKILTLYNTPFQTTSRIKDEKVITVKNPFLNIYGTATENIIDNLNPNSTVSGLLARFLVFWFRPDQEYPSYNSNLDTGIPFKLLENLKSIKGGGSTVRFDNDAKEWFDIFCKTAQRVQMELYRKAAKVDSLVGNLQEQSSKIALLVAKSQRVELKVDGYTSEIDAPISISLHDIQWAVSVALHCFFNNIAMAGLLTENKDEKYLNKIFEYLNSNKGKWVRRRDLCKSLRYAIRARQLDELLEPFFESKQIIKIISKKGGGALYRLNPNKGKTK